MHWKRDTDTRICRANIETMLCLMPLKLQSSEQKHLEVGGESSRNTRVQVGNGCTYNRSIFLHVGLEVLASGVLGVMWKLAGVNCDGEMGLDGDVAQRVVLFFVCFLDRISRTRRAKTCGLGVVGEKGQEHCILVFIKP